MSDTLRANGRTWTRHILELGRTLAHPAGNAGPLMSEDRMIEDRLTPVETLLTHLQHDLEQLHQALVGQSEDLANLRKEVEQLRGHVERLEENPENRDPRQERPPHY